MKTSLNTSTRYLLTITTLVAVVVLANWLWTLTTFWSAIYVGEHKLQTLFYYHLYRSPMLLAVGLSFWAFYKKNPFWLLGNVLLADAATFFVFGAIWLLGAQLAEPELIETVPLMNEWLVLVFFSFSVITLVIHWTNDEVNFKQLPTLMKYLIVYIIVLSTARIIIDHLSMVVFGPLVYIASAQSSLIEQLQLLLKGLPQTLLALLAIWAVLSQRLHYFLVIVLAGLYYTFFSPAPLIEGMKVNWGETDILAIAGTISAISMLVLYLSAFIIFCVWLYRWKPAQQYPG